MSKLSNGIFGLVVASAAFGAVQLASGSDLSSQRGDARQTGQSEPVTSLVNRDTKGDRVSVSRITPGKTLSFQTESLSGTSVLLRLPAAPVETARNAPVPRSTRHQAMLACEPVVSVLTVIAKQLPPGRCVT